MVVMFLLPLAWDKKASRWCMSVPAPINVPMFGAADIRDMHWQGGTMAIGSGIDI